MGGLPDFYLFEECEGLVCHIVRSGQFRFLVMPYQLLFIYLNSFSFLWIFWDLLSSADGSLHLIEEFRVCLEEFLGIFTSLAELGLAVCIERS